jgi:hypothetical protein
MRHQTQLLCNDDTIIKVTSDDTSDLPFTVTFAEEPFGAGLSIYLSTEKARDLARLIQNELDGLDHDAEEAASAWDEDSCPRCGCRIVRYHGAPWEHLSDGFSSGTLSCPIVNLDAEQQKAWDAYQAARKGVTA